MTPEYRYFYSLACLFVYLFVGATVYASSDEICDYNGCGRENCGREKRGSFDGLRCWCYLSGCGVQGLLLTHTHGCRVLYQSAVVIFSIPSPMDFHNLFFSELGSWPMGRDSPLRRRKERRRKKVRGRSSGECPPETKKNKKKQRDTSTQQLSLRFLGL